MIVWPKVDRKWLSIGVSLLCCASSAQVVSSTAPAKWLTATPLDFGFGLSRLKLPHNGSEQINQELSDPEIIRAIAKRAGLSEADLATIVIVPSSTGAVTVYQVAKPDKPFTIMSDRLRDYGQARAEGHTKAFLWAGLTNTVPLLTIPDTDLRVLVMNRPFIPASLIEKFDAGTQTNKAGSIAGTSTTTTIINGRVKTTSHTNRPASDQICRWVRYRATDGDIEWIYMLNFGPDGRLTYISDTKRDAKEGDPKFQKTIKDAEDEAKAEMKRRGVLGQLGAVHTFWRLKKEKLKTQGIAWFSPAELNPGTCYD